MLIAIECLNRANFYDCLQRNLILSNKMLVLPNVTMEPLNVRKNKIKEPPNMTKVHMSCWNCTIWGWYYQMWEKIMSTTECNKSTVKYDVSTVQCDNGTIKCENK